MRARYYSQRNPGGSGWTVIDRSTGAPAETNGTPHDNVAGEDVDELVEMFNSVEARQQAVAKKTSRFRLKIRRDRYYSSRDPDGDGWAVFDTTTGALAAVNGSSSSGLSLEDADDMVDMLNRIEARKV